MRPPRNIIVDDVSVTVEEVDRLGRFRDGYRQGGSCYGKRIKLLKRGISRDAKRVTLMHELLHYMLRRAGFDLSSKTEEYVIDCLDSFLVPCLRDNPSLVEFLLEP